jgi:uncharacterized phage protein gp47/JayE
MITYKSRTEIANNISKSLIRNVGISAREQGTLIKSLVDALSVELERSYDNVAELVSNTYLSEAKGPYLDMLGNLFGVERLLSGEKKFIDGIRFYTKDGKPLKEYVDQSFFRKITVCSSKQGGNIEVSEIVNPIQLEKGYIDLSGTVIEPGNYHYPLGSIDTYFPDKSYIEVTNVLESYLKVDGEGDNSFRNRIAKTMSGKRFGTAESIYLAGYALPGIADIIVDDVNTKPGSVDVFVVPNDLSSSAAAAKEVKRTILSIIPKGILVNVYPADLVLVKVSATLKPTVEINNTNVFKQSVIRTLKLGVDNLKSGEKLNKSIMNQILSRVENLEGYETTQLKFIRRDKFGYEFPMTVSEYELSYKERFSMHPVEPLELTVIE